MFSRTDALYNTLRTDLKDQLTDYQFRYSLSGSPIWPDASVVQAACHAQVSKIFSKLTYGRKLEKAACQAALEKFTHVNRGCSFFEFPRNTSVDEQLIGELKSRLYDFFIEDGNCIFGGYEDVVSNGGVGPGASLSARGDDLYTKVFDSPLSFTKESLLNAWEFTVSQNDTWFEALVRLYHDGRIPAAVEGNKLSFVSKNTKIARTICTEPTINMWFQLGLGNIITKRLKSYFGIDLSSQQTVNRTMAYLASIGQDFCTIDLESASDSISMGFLKEVLPPEAYWWFAETRSPCTTLPDGTVVQLEMVSTMGNGFTFPLQTAIFAAVVCAAYDVLGCDVNKTRHITTPDRVWGMVPFGLRADDAMPQIGNFSVFGDDIICSKRSYALVVKLLHMCGFTVNANKSFSQGQFYESCGSDYYNGQNIRPFYIKRLETQQDLYKAINGLNRWSAMQGIVLHETVQLLLSWMRRKPLYVPMYDADDAGLQVPLATALSLSSPKAVKQVLPGTYSFLRNAPQKRYLLIKEDVIACGRDQKARRYNPAGLYLSFLYGCVRGYRISLRQRVVRYRTERRVSPNWDTLSPLCRSLGIGWRRLADATTINLIG